MSDVTTRAGMALLMGIPLPMGGSVAPSVDEITAIETEAAAVERARIREAVEGLPDAASLPFRTLSRAAVLALLEAPHVE
jgi:hypothetical protein